MVRAVETPDGRVIEVHDGGDLEGLPVVVHHGTPSSGLPYAPHTALAHEQGVRLIGYDRSGYGGSTRHPGRRVADCVADVHAIADALGLERFAAWGISGGGPHALACAGLCDDRLTAVASLAGIAPWGAEGLDWLAGMGEANHVEFGRILEGEEALRELLEADAAAMVESDPEELVRVLETLLGASDRAVLSGWFAEWFLETERHAVEQGIDGWVDDDLAFVEDWGFEPSQARVPVLLLHGGDDRFVPISHAHWLAARIPGVEVRLGPNDGHLTLAEAHMREVNEWLLEHS